MAVADGRVGPYWEHVIVIALPFSVVATLLSHRNWLFPEWVPPLPTWSLPFVIGLCAIVAIFTRRNDIRINEELRFNVSQRVPLRIVWTCAIWSLLVVEIMVRDLLGR